MFVAVNNDARKNHLFKDHDDDKHIAYEHIAYSKFGKDYFQHIHMAFKEPKLLK